MTPKKAKLLSELVKEMDEKDKGFIPAEAWAAIQTAFVIPYIELFVARQSATGDLEFILIHRQDEHWDGWHIPGGIWRTHLTAEDACNALSRKELGTTSGVELLAHGMWEKWNDHPYGNPISHVCICRSLEVIEETESMRWFREIPDGMIADGGHSKRFITDALQKITEQNLFI